MKHKNNLFICIFLTTVCLSCGSSNTTTRDTHQETTKESTMQTLADPHTFAQPDKAKMTHLNLEVVVDFEQKIISGKAHIHIEKSADARELYLDTQGLDIQEVRLDEDSTAVDFTLEDPVEHLGTALNIPLKEATKVVHITYATRPGAEALQWLSPQQTFGKKLPFLFTQSQAILARSWVPCQDSPGIRFTYEATVTVPETMLALMSAENPQEKNASGVYAFTMPQPIPAYLLALSVGDLVFEDLGEQTGVYAEPGQLAAAADEFADLPAMLKAAEALYGKYRWGRYDLIVLPPSFPFGGMENPRLTFATPTILAGDRSLVSLVAHELAHSWSGNLVTNATWNDFWLNEGFTVYFELRIMEAVYGKDYAEMLSYLGYQDLEDALESLAAEDTHLKLDLKGRNPDDGVTSIAYEKGSFFLKSIEAQVGREKWDAFVKQYFDAYAFKTMNTEGFLDYLSKAFPNLDQTLDVNAWVYQAGLPEGFQVSTSERFSKVAEALRQWQEGTALTQLETSEWSSHEWLFFIRQLPEDLDIPAMQSLDETFQFTQSGNSEILAAWLELAIKREYEAAYPALEQFLIAVGRRKFLVPLYRSMANSTNQKQMALDIYTKARENYHFVSIHTIDQILDYSTE